MGQSQKLPSGKRGRVGCDQASQDMSIVVDSKPTSNMPSMPFKESGLDAVVDDWLKYCLSCQHEVLHRFSSVSFKTPVLKPSLNPSARPVFHMISEPRRS